MIGCLITYIYPESVMGFHTTLNLIFSFGKLQSLQRNFLGHIFYQQNLLYSDLPKISNELHLVKYQPLQAPFHTSSDVQLTSDRVETVDSTYNRRNVSLTSLHY